MSDSSPDRNAGLAPGVDSDRPPNVVLVVADDQGYGDLGCYGSPSIHTPRIDRMAAEGTKYTSFTVSSPVCTPSRASFLTGCYPSRVGLAEGVLFPDDDEGLHPDERTVADVLGDAGYATACVGKWHLGHWEPFLPTNHGFDSYLGVPYSNDMRPDNVHGDGDCYPPLPLYRDTQVVERSVEQSTLVGRYTDAALDFVTDAARRDDPFFLYLPHTMPHVPLYASPEFEGTSRRGRYGDVVEEIDASTGRILDRLDELGIEEETLVLFTSDNGPWLEMGVDGGDAGPLRGGKATTHEGGVRVPFVARWPGTISSGTVCRELLTAMDLLPTLASLAGASVPDDRVVDGADASDLLLAPESTPSPRERFHYVDVDGRQRAVRDAAGWKYRLDEGELYHLDRDPGERFDVAGERPDVVDRLAEKAAAWDREMDETARPVGRVGSR